MLKRALVLSLFAAAVPTVVHAQAAAAPKACTTAQMVLGNPRFAELTRPKAEGAPILEGPPLQFRSLVFRGAELFTNDGQEVWIADMRAGQMKRIAGEYQKGNPKLLAGPCPASRFINITGMSAYPDGSLVVADSTGHAVLKIVDPTGPACAVITLAGTNIPAEREGTKGDEDGPGKTAKLTTPRWPVVDGDGNVYFVEFASRKLKKIANDADHTVSTVTTLFDNKGYGYNGIVLIGSKIYVIGNTFSNALVFEIDPTTGEQRKIVDAGAKKFAPLDATTAPTLSSATTDGKTIIATGQGYIWRITTEGKVSHIGGGGSSIEFPVGYDVKASMPAKKAVLRFRNGDASSMGTTTALAWQNGVLFWRGRSDGAYVMSLACK